VYLRHDTIASFLQKNQFWPKLSLTGVLQPGDEMVTWSMTSRVLKSQTRDLSKLIAQYLENSWRCYLATIVIRQSSVTRWA